MNTNILSSNTLKIIACLSMAIDHIGLLLFPEQLIFRFIGRLAMPIFAFFIAEGCRKTSNIKAYFLRTFVLGVLCQLFYIANDLMMGGISSLYLNILFTLSLSIALCYAVLSLEAALKNKDKAGIPRSLAGLLSVSAVIAALLIFCRYSQELIGIKVTIDYSYGGVLLPLFALFGKNKVQKLIVFALGIALYCASYMDIFPFIHISFLALPFLALYSGERGKYRLKYFFYAFYPLHLGAIYLIKILFFQ